jgi:hypothetical protein
MQHLEAWEGVGKDTKRSYSASLCKISQNASRKKPTQGLLLYLSGTLMKGLYIIKKNAIESLLDNFEITNNNSQD